MNQYLAACTDIVQGEGQAGEVQPFDFGHVAGRGAQEPGDLRSHHHAPARQAQHQIGGHAFVAQQPSLESSMKSILVAVNHEFAFPDQVISPHDEIALFPPVSGG